MKKLIAILLLPFSAFCQNTIGLPEVINYPRQTYQGGTQNWDFQQDRSGILYVANNEGLLNFDGSSWSLHSLPNKTIVRSVRIGPDERIYVGGQDEMGYFQPDRNGNLVYQSFTSQVPEKSRSFGDVWDIVTRQKDVFFRSAGKIFQMTGNQAVVYEAPSEWAFMGMCNSRLYAHDAQAGLFVFENNIWNPLPGTDLLPKSDPVTAILPSKEGRLLLTTLKNGLFYYDGNKINRHPSPNNRIFSEERVYAAIALDENWLALATSNKGVYIVDRKGNIIQQFSKAEQLQNNNVLSIFLDQQKNLWLGLDNGIDLIAYNSAIKHITPMLQDASGYAALIHNGHLYAGTSNGLFRAPLGEAQDLSFSKSRFEPVSNTRGQTWTLAEINNRVLLGHHEGAFVVEENTARQISTEAGSWNFVPLSSVFPAQQIASGTYKGIRFFDYRSGSFAPSDRISGFDESSRFLSIDTDGHIWVSHPYHGVYRIVKTGNNQHQVTSFGKEKGLPSLLNNHAYKIRNQTVVASESGVYTYNPGKERFEPDPFYQKLLGTKSLRYLKEDKEGNIWFIHDKTLGVIDLSANEPEILYLPELTNKMLSGFEFIYPVDKNNIFLGGEKGFYHINYEKYRKNVPVLNVQVRKVRIREARDSLLYGGHAETPAGDPNNPNTKIPRITDEWKSILLEFSSTLFGYQSNLEYSYRLKGFDDQWSAWSSRTDKEYTNLGQGTYTFEVKARNNLGNESLPATFTFIILPPWYLTIWAKILYGFLLLITGFLLYRWQDNRFREQEKKFEEEQRRLKYIHDLERSKTEGELVALRNEKLEAEINFKNSEMASSAMHLVKKGEMLSKIKGDLSQMLKRLDNEQAIAEIKKMIKSLNEDEHIDEEWESFTKHFDKVHSDYIITLKKIHPALTGNELKLCTYLRMNLSTKEIAQLMNISVRGVEISRYRLRKKLGLASEMSLFDYLIGIKEQKS